jgi:hypothetical protein
MESKILGDLFLFTLIQNVCVLVLQTLLNNSRLPEKLLRIISEKQQKSNTNHSVQQEQVGEILIVPYM